MVIALVLSWITPPTDESYTLQICGGTRTKVADERVQGKRIRQVEVVAIEEKSALRVDLLIYSKQARSQGSYLELRRLFRVPLLPVAESAA
jgi:hypothetical protein